MDIIAVPLSSRFFVALLFLFYTNELLINILHVPAVNSNTGAVDKDEITGTTAF